MRLKNTFYYETIVKNADLNDGDHLSFISLVKIIRDVRNRFFLELGSSEGNLDGNNTGLILTNAETKIRCQSTTSDMLNIELTVKLINKYICHFDYRIKNVTLGKLTAQMKEEFCYYNYKSRKTMTVPIEFEKILSLP